MVSIKKIQNKRSAVKGSVPTASDIEYGEIAINYFDGDEQIFIRNTNTTPTLVNFRTDEQNHNNFVDSYGDTMTGGLNISADGLNVTGNTLLNNNLTVKGNTSLQSLTVTHETVGGTITATGAIYSSDKRLKENIKPISDNDIIKVSDVELKSFNMIKDENKIKRYGVIAQDLEAVGLNELVRFDENGMRGVDYTEFLLLKIAQLEQEINELKNNINK